MKPNFKKLKQETVISKFQSKREKDKEYLRSDKNISKHLQLLPLGFLSFLFSRFLKYMSSE